MYTEDKTTQIIRFSFCTVFLVMFIAVCFFALSTFDAKAKQRITTQVNIASISLSSEVNGNFTIGCGQVDEEKYYVYYELYADGGKELKQIKAANVKIYDTLVEGEQPYFTMVTSGLGGIVSSEFHLPIGAVTTTYDLDVSKIK